MGVRPVDYVGTTWLRLDYPPLLDANHTPYYCYTSQGNNTIRVFKGYPQVSLTSEIGTMEPIGSANPILIGNYIYFTDILDSGSKYLGMRKISTSSGSVTRIEDTGIASSTYNRIQTASDYVRYIYVHLLKYSTSPDMVFQGIILRYDTSDDSWYTLCAPGPYGYQKWGCGVTPNGSYFYFSIQETHTGTYNLYSVSTSGSSASVVATSSYPIWCGWKGYHVIRSGSSFTLYNWDESSSSSIITTVAIPTSNQLPYIYIDDSDASNIKVLYHSRMHTAPGSIRYEARLWGGPVLDYGSISGGYGLANPYFPHIVPFNYSGIVDTSSRYAVAGDGIYQWDQRRVGAYREIL
jgi:hypothetical protein